MIPTVATAGALAGLAALLAAACRAPNDPHRCTACGHVYRRLRGAQMAATVGRRVPSCGRLRRRGRCRGDLWRL